VKTNLGDLVFGQNFSCKLNAAHVGHANVQDYLTLIVELEILHACIGSPYEYKNIKTPDTKGQPQCASVLVLGPILNLLLLIEDHH